MAMFQAERLIFIHGLEGSSQGVKATLLRGMYPEALIPDFRGSLDERMAALEAALEMRTRENPEHGEVWTLAGSSFGGLMAAMYACRFPGQVRKLALFAPALIWPDFAAAPPAPVDVPTVVYHGTQDAIIPLEAVRPLAERVFTDLDFRTVEDDHGLYRTVHEIDWLELLG